MLVRIHQNPDYYQSKAKNGSSIEQQLEDLCLEKIRFLHDNTLCVLSPSKMIQPTGRRLDRIIILLEYGKIMAKYYVRANTMIYILGMKKKSSLQEILEVLSRSEEFPVKFGGDKAHLNALNKNLAMKYVITS